MKKSILTSLSECPLFAEIEEEKLKSIAEDFMTVSQTEKNEIIFSENSYTRSLVIILKGRASVVKNSGKAKILMSVLRKGDVFGMATLFYEKDNFLTEITALEKTTLAVFSKENVKKLFEQYPAVSENYITILSEKIHFLNRKISTYTKSEAIQKVAAFILQNADEGKKSAALPYSITAVADALNVGRASVYRAFESLENDGIITRNGKKIIINSPDELENIQQ